MNARTLSLICLELEIGVVEYLMVQRSGNVELVNVFTNEKNPEFSLTLVNLC